MPRGDGMIALVMALGVAPLLGFDLGEARGGRWKE
jgi:hypothetical protein